MSKIAEKKQQIEKIKKEIYEFRNNKKGLENEIQELKRKVESFENDYEQLIMTGKQDEADKLFIDNKSLRDEYDLKNKRLQTMEKLNGDQVIVDKWREISLIANSLEDAYREEHDNHLEEYLKAVINLESKRSKLEEISNAHINYNYALNVEGSRHLQEIGKTDVLLNLVSREVFPEFYINDKLKEFREKQ